MKYKLRSIIVSGFMALSTLFGNTSYASEPRPPENLGHGYYRDTSMGTLS